MGIGSGKRDQMYSKVHMTDVNGRAKLIMLLGTACHEHLYLCTGLHTLISFSHHNSAYEWKRARFLHESTNLLVDWSSHLNIFKPTWSFYWACLLWECVNCAAICSHPLAWHAHKTFPALLQRHTHELGDICVAQVLKNVCRIWKKMV